MVQTSAAPEGARRVRVAAPPRNPRPDRRGLRDIRRHLPRLSHRRHRLLADRVPVLLKSLREHDPDFVLLGGTLA